MFTRFDHNEAPICEYGPTNYPNPQNMSQIDKDLFKYNYPSNMTTRLYKLVNVI